MSRGEGSWLQFGQEWRKTVSRKLEGKISTGGTEGMGRRGRPMKLQKVALFLASDDSSFVTGIELFVDGGRAQI